MSVPPKSLEKPLISSKATFFELSLYGMTISPRIFEASYPLPKLISENDESLGRDLTNKASASFANYMRLLHPILPLLSTMNMKWKSAPLLSLTCSGFSSLTTSKKS